MMDDDTKRAFARLMNIPEGRFIYGYLQAELMIVGRASDAGALYRENGRRSLAQDLMTAMAEGFDASAGPDQPKPAPQRQPVAGARSRGLARRVTRSDTGSTRST